MMKKTRMFSVLVLLGGVVGPFCVHAQDDVKDANDLPLYDSKGAAHQHCPKDVIVWIDRQTNSFYLKGEMWYGTTENGGYMCRDDAWENGFKEAKKS
jgi:hypothetical protein